MSSVLFFSFILLIGLSVGFLTNDMKYSKHNLHRISREQQRALRSIMGKLIDTETNTIYHLEGQKQQGFLSNDAGASGSTRYLEDLACLEACYRCVEDYPLVTRKKKAADNCGPMCDCANSCSRMSIEQIEKVYGEGASRGDKNCFWTIYTQSLHGDLPTLK